MNNSRDWAAAFVASTLRVLPTLLLGVAIGMLTTIATTRSADARMPRLVADATTTTAAAVRDGSKDFDFLIGKWSTKNQRLLRPLSA